MKKQLAAFFSAVLFLLMASPSLASQAIPYPENMGPAINSFGGEMETTFTPDGNTMYFACTARDLPVRPDIWVNFDICVSHRINGQWTKAETVGAPISSVYMEVEPLLSRDGNKLYFMSLDRPGGLAGDIWVSEKQNGLWTEPVNLGPPINSPIAGDHCLQFAGLNEDTAFFTSTRPGGYGGNDIWTTKKVDGVWQEPVNLGPKVNTPFGEHHSLPSADGKSLYITSDRPGAFGDEDIYVTTMDESGQWGTPVNLGPLVNTIFKDACPYFSRDYKDFYFYSNRPGGYGQADIWWMKYEDLQRYGSRVKTLPPLPPFFTLMSMEEYFLPLSGGFSCHLALPKLPGSP